MNRSLIYLVLLLAVSGANALKGYTFQQGRDSTGGDIDQLNGATIAELKSRCDADVNCKGFNTLGFLKGAIVPTPQYAFLSDKLSQGLYVKTPYVDGYSFTQGMDSLAGDLRSMLGASIPDLKVACDADPACVGFTAYGYLKSSIATADKWVYSSNDPLVGIYAKVGVTVDNYSFWSARDTGGEDIMQVIGSLGDIKAACDADVNCVGFNSAGWLKRLVRPQAQWNPVPSARGQEGLFVKTANVDGYNFFQGMDIFGGDIRSVPGADVNTLKQACHDDKTCQAFTTFGFIKNVVPAELQWHHTSNDPLAGTYMKHSAKSKAPKATKLPKGTCWLQSYGRGVGKPITTCRDGQEKDGALCYPPCDNGFNGVGPVCWQNCPDGYRDTGVDCLKPGSYGRGAGYAIWHEGKCNSENSQGCEKWGAMWYPRCRPGFHNAACCVCSPDCPNGLIDIGVSCQKKTYGRGAGQVLKCADGQDESAGLCYDYCRDGYKGIGPVCWDQCPPNLDACGALCVPSGQCAGKILSIASSTIKGATQIAGAVADLSAGDPTAIVGGVNGVNKVLSGFNYPICGQTGGVLDPVTQVTGVISNTGKKIKKLVGGVLGGEDGDDSDFDGDDLDDDEDLGDLDDVADIADLLMIKESI